MKTMKQQLLAMLRHRLLPERSRRATRWHVLMLMLALLIGGSPQAWADRMRDNDYFKMYWSGNHDHVHFSLLAADLDGQNTYSKSGTIKATCGGTTYEILKIHSTGSGKDSGDSWKVYGMATTPTAPTGAACATSPTSRPAASRRWTGATVTTPTP